MKRYQLFVVLAVSNLFVYKSNIVEIENIKRRW